MNPRHSSMAIGLASLLLLAGCGGGGGTEEPDSTTSSSSSPSADESSTATPEPATEVTLTAEPFGKAPNMTPMAKADQKRWQKEIRSALAAPGIAGTTGAWVAVSLPDQGFWAGAVGTSAVDGPKATIADHSRIGSISKTFTATAILEQVAAGKLALGDTVEELLPDLASKFPVTAALTIEQLLTMTSGLPDYANLKGGAFAQAASDPEKEWTPDELIQAALDAGDPTTPGTPGYTTTAYTILGLVLEDVTGDPIETVLTGVAQEAGLTQTALTAPGDNAMPEPFAHGYQDATGVASMKALGADVPQGTDMTNLDVTTLGGAGGGMYSTIGDLFNWAVTGSGSSLLPEDVAAERVDLVADIGGGSMYGEGVMNFPYMGGLIGHSGQSIGYTALVGYDPETGAAVAMMINSTEGLNGLLQATIGELSGA